jgi:hypothetical protein
MPHSLRDLPFFFILYSCCIKSAAVESKLFGVFSFQFSNKDTMSSFSGNNQYVGVKLSFFDYFIAKYCKSNHIDLLRDYSVKDVFYHFIFPLLSPSSSSSSAIEEEGQTESVKSSSFHEYLKCEDLSYVGYVGTANVYISFCWFHSFLDEIEAMKSLPAELNLLSEDIYVYYPPFFFSHDDSIPPLLLSSNHDVSFDLISSIGRVAMILTSLSSNEMTELKYLNTILDLFYCYNKRLRLHIISTSRHLYQLALNILSAGSLEHISSFLSFFIKIEDLLDEDHGGLTKRFLEITRFSSNSTSVTDLGHMLSKYLRSTILSWINSSVILSEKCYARIGLMGNPSDGFNGKTLSFLIRNFAATVLIMKRNDKEIILKENTSFLGIDHFLSQCQIVGYHSSGLKLIQATCKTFFAFCKNANIDLSLFNGFSMNFSTTIPRMVSVLMCSIWLWFTSFVLSVILPRLAYLDPLLSL